MLSYKMIENVEVYGINDSIKASKYPMATNIKTLDCGSNKTTIKLASADVGSGHDNFLKGIVVQFDLTMTPKMSVELERYHFIDFVSSQSTMHRITKFDLDNSYIEYVDKRIIDIMKEKVTQYNVLLNDKDSNKEKLNKLYLEILYSNPCGFKLTARMTTNYQQLKTIYYQRKNHRLPEWKEFCAWIETLPLFDEFILSPKKYDAHNKLKFAKNLRIGDKIKLEYGDYGNFIFCEILSLSKIVGAKYNSVSAIIKDIKFDRISSYEVVFKENDLVQIYE